MKTLYSYAESFRRMGDLEGLFVADSEKVKELKGKTCYFGDVLGKHSEVYTDEWFDNLEVITDDPAVIDIIEKYSLETGYDPVMIIMDGC